MSERGRTPLPLIPTGVPGLDAILGGGLPEYSFNLIVGSPGSGKTTLAHQIMFANATPARPALYLTVLGEPTFKMLRYQQRMRYFDPDAVGKSVHFVDLGEIALQGNLAAVLVRMVELVDERAPALVVVDSFQNVVRKAVAEPGDLSLQGFVQQLAVRLTGWEATTFLLGEYLTEIQDNPVFTVADGILRLTQNTDRNSVVRKLQMVKSRGQAPMPGLHTFRITEGGIEAFPRMETPTGQATAPRERTRISSGVESLDGMLDGGFLAGDAVMISGPSGTGKSVLATQFIAAGTRDGEPGVIAVFEEHPVEYIVRAQSLGIDLEGMIARNELRMIYIRPLDLSPDETLQEIRDAVREIGAKRVVIDSLTGFELALAPTFREDFRESMYRLASSLTDTGVTVLMTMEIVQTQNGLQFSPNVVSFLADDILLLRYVEIGGEIRKSLAVIKMRGSNHRKDLRAYEITEGGMVLHESLRDYEGILSGTTIRHAGAKEQRYPGLIAAEEVVLGALFTLDEAPLAAVTRRTGLPEREVIAALSRLVALDYAEEQAETNGRTYRAKARER